MLAALHVLICGGMAQAASYSVSAIYGWDFPLGGTAPQVSGPSAGVSGVQSGQQFNFGVIKFQQASRASPSTPQVFSYDRTVNVIVNRERLTLLIPITITVGADRNVHDRFVVSPTSIVFPNNNIVLTVTPEEPRTFGGGGYFMGTEVPLQAVVSPNPNGPPSQLDADATGPGKVCRAEGCTTWSFSPSTVSLSLHDMPVGYRPPVGPAVEFHVHYAQRDVQQPQVFNYGNLGRQWTSNWTSHISETTGSTRAAKLYLRGGGAETYAFAGTGSVSSRPGPFSQAVLVRTLGVGGATSGYTRTLNDGSSEEFNRAVGSQFFLSAVVDRTGQRVTLTYDATNRLTTLTDAIGQRTTLSYGGSDPLKLTKVTDPFGRAATFGYDSSGLLTSIRDTIGIESQMRYGPGTFVNRLSTPYGTTRFEFGDSTTDVDYYSTRMLLITDARGRRTRVEYNNLAPGIADSEATVPTGMSTANRQLSQRNTYIWNPTQYAEATRSGSLDYTKASIIHWLKDSNADTVSRVVGSRKEPLESRVWFAYPGQPDPTTVGTASTPIRIGRVMADGRTQLWAYERNDLGMVLQSVDPLGRTLAYSYASNGIDLLGITNVSAGNQQLAALTYNAQHLPLTIRGANGSTSTYEYNSFGLPARFVDPLGNASTYSYSQEGYLQRVQGPIAAASQTLAHDARGRVVAATSSTGYRVDFTYDDIDRPVTVSFPDGTRTTYAYNLLDLASITDRRGNRTTFTRDAERRLTRTRDPLNKTVDFEYSGAGTLVSVKDQNGRETTWSVDLQDRVVSKRYADGTVHRLEFDVTGRTVKRTDALGQITATSYNLDDSVASVSYLNAVNATPGVSYTYDAGFLRPLTMTDGTGVTTYAYHAAGIPGGTRLRSVSSPIPGGTGHDTITYAYDALDRVISQAVNGTAETTTYDALGRVTKVANALDTFDYAYSDGTSRVTGVSSGQGPRLAVEYFDSTGNELLKQLTYTAANGTLLSQFGYTHDANYNVTSFAERYINQRLTADGGPMAVGAGSTGVGGMLVAALTAPTDQAQRQASVGRRFSSSSGLLVLLGLLLGAAAWQLARRHPRRWLWPVAPVALSLALGSCGGGRDPEHPLAATPQTATAAQRALLGLPAADEPERAKVLATGGGSSYGGTSAQDAVEQLFNAIAEPVYAELFPGHKQTQTFERYRYRYYPETGTYVGVAVDVTPGDGLVESGIYVMGGSFGNAPSYVGRLLDFFTPAAAAAGSVQVTSYAYDALDRLVSGSVGTDLVAPTGSPRHAYRYDSASNMLSMTLNGTPKSQAVSATNAIATASHDDNGNLLALNGWTYVWDASDRLVTAKNGQSESSFSYDGESRLVRIVDRLGGVITSDKSYLWCGLARCVERDNTNGAAPVSKKYFSQGVVANDERLHYVTDNLGSVRQLVRSDGHVRVQYAFDPYGNRTKVNGDAAADMSYASLFNHSATGLEMGVYRAFSAPRGRWMNRDPIRERGGINLYSYVAGNPISATDATGLTPSYQTGYAGSLVKEWGERLSTRSEDEVLHTATMAGAGELIKVGWAARGFSGAAVSQQIVISGAEVLIRRASFGFAAYGGVLTGKFAFYPAFKLAVEGTSDCSYSENIDAAAGWIERHAFDPAILSPALDTMFMRTLNEMKFPGT